MDIEGLELSKNKFTINTKENSYEIFYNKEHIKEIEKIYQDYISIIVDEMI
ncbi:MAG: hypothetical protein JSW06_02975 [Thermoplasmatales archaeon]|nr:MAG: hypothetical protein JSW06_02975 [Thermoplasmatales archaeon]